jgi:hypothetical protein
MNRDPGSTADPWGDPVHGKSKGFLGSRAQALRGDVVLGAV